MFFQIRGLDLMNHSVKTYGLSNQSGDKVDFILKDIGEVYDHLNGIDDDPHRHDYYTMVLVKQGNGQHYIDFNKFEINNYSLHLVFPGQVHQISTPEKPEGWVMNFSLEFLLQNNIHQKIIDRVYLYNTYGYSPPLHLPLTDFEDLEHIILQVKYYSHKELTFQYDALGALLKLFFIRITSLCSLQNSVELEQATGSNSLFVNFKRLIEEKYTKLHKVSEYADILAVSSDYLNKYVKTQSGKSAKEFIQDKILVEAKRILLFTDNSNKELAFELGFEEPSHFSNFFKKNVGETPGQFRTKNRNKIL